MCFCVAHPLLTLIKRPSFIPQAAVNKEKVEFKQEEEMTDAFGNVIKVKAAKRLKMSNKEKKVRRDMLS